MDPLPLSLDPLPLRVEFPFQISLETINFFFSISLRDALSALDKVGINKDIFGCDPVPKEVFIRRTKEVLEEKQANYVKKE